MLKIHSELHYYKEKSDTTIENISLVLTGGSLYKAAYTKHIELVVKNMTLFFFYKCKKSFDDLLWIQG